MMSPAAINTVSFRVLNLHHIKRAPPQAQGQSEERKAPDMNAPDTNAPDMNAPDINAPNERKEYPASSSCLLA